MYEPCSPRPSGDLEMSTFRKRTIREIGEYPMVIMYVTTSSFGIAQFQKQKLMSRKRNLKQKIGIDNIYAWKSEIPQASENYQIMPLSSKPEPYLEKQDSRWYEFKVPFSKRGEASSFDVELRHDSVLRPEQSELQIKKIS